MSKIILSADSACDLRPSQREKYGISYFPYHVILNGKSYIDGVDITADDIYRTWREKKLLPQTAAINVIEYQEYFKHFTDRGYEVIHLSLGGALSSSAANARLAAQSLKGVYAVDSKNLSSGMGLLALCAGDMIAKGGLSASEIVEKLREMTGKVHTSFILDTLEFMHAGGRCSAVAMLGANLLKIKPCIAVDNSTGAMSVTKKYRGSLASVHEQYVKDQLTAYDNVDTSRIFITHSGIDHSYVERVRRAIESVMHFDEIYDGVRASCTISSHCGPNCLGILFMTR